MKYYIILFFFYLSGCSDVSVNTELSIPDEQQTLISKHENTSSTKVSFFLNESIKPGWKLIFQDEFEQPKLSNTNWNRVNSGYKDHGRLHHYLPEQVFISKGSLFLKVEKNSYKDFPYRSGAVTTEGKHEQLYGKFEIRAKFPKGQGLFPAIWLLPSNGEAYPEIDIVEMLGQLPHELWHVAHIDDGQREYKLTTDMNGSEWHIYTLDWLEDELIFYVDKIEQFRTPNISNTPMFLWMNVAVGGTWVGDPDEDTLFPAAMEIDYVRIYSKE